MLSTRGIMKSLGRAWRGRKYAGTELPVFPEANHLKPFIDNKLAAVLTCRRAELVNLDRCRPAASTTRRDRATARPKRSAYCIEAAPSCRGGEPRPLQPALPGTRRAIASPSSSAYGFDVGCRPALPATRRARGRGVGASLVPCPASTRAATSTTAAR
jgi:hypothetical protein